MVTVSDSISHSFIPNKPCVNHLDRNPSNNHISNLEWATYSENQRHSFSNGRVAWHKGKKMSDEYKAICRKTHDMNSANKARLEKNNEQTT